MKTPLLTKPNGPALPLNYNPYRTIMIGDVNETNVQSPNPKKKPTSQKATTLL